MKKFYVLGSNISYSLSPKIFAELFRVFGDNAQYSIMDIRSDELFRIKDIALSCDGFNVTKPFKTEILRYLSIDKSECGSVNTVTTQNMTGYSTDGDGFLFDLERNFSGASSSKVLVLGYGGAAKAVVNALKKSGACVAVTGRNERKANEFALANGVLTYDDSFKPIGVVSCTSETFVPRLKDKVDFCYDLRYAGDTLSLDAPSANGLGMLIAQAIYAYRIFMDKQIDNDEIKELYFKIREKL